jgi:glycosyltransferase involved in cell wall biosynthesis
MRVLQVVHNFTGEHRGGTELYTRSLSRALVDRGHSVRVFTTRVGTARRLRIEERDGLEVAEAEHPPSGSFRERARMHREIRDRFEAHAREFAADVVHVQHLIDISPTILGVPRRLGVPGLVSLHDYWYRCPRTTLLRKDGTVCTTGPQGGFACVRHCRPATSREDHADIAGGKGPVRPRDLAYVARYLRLDRAIREVDRFVAGSEFTRRTYAKLGVDPGRIEVIPWGLAGSGPAGGRRRRPGGPVRFAFLGHLSPAKGADLAIRAFAGIDPARAVLTLHGPMAEPQAPRFRALLDAAPNVRWAGPYEASGLPGILADADAVVMPSRALENYPLVVQEAFQHGVPMVVSRAGSLPEVVRDGVDGVVFGSTEEDLRRAAEGLADDPARLARLAGGVPAVKPMAVHAAEIEELYSRLRGAPA